MMQQYMKELEQEPFDAEEFVERLAWRTIAETKNDGDEDFNPTLLHDSFVQAIKDLTLLQERQKKKCERLEAAVREDEALFFQKIHDLLGQNKQAIDTFQELDGKINHVATKVLHLGDQLDSVNGPRARVVDAKNLMTHLNEFLQTGPLTSEIFTDSSKIDEAAEVIQKLYLISQDLPSPKFEGLKRKIERKYDETERTLIEEFSNAQRRDDFKRMKEIANVLSQFKGYPQCVDAYIERSQAGCLLSKDVFSRLFPLCELNYDVIKKVFNNPEQVLAKFVLNLYHLKLQEYIASKLSSKLDSYNYLKTLYELYDRTNQLSQDLSVFNMGSDKNYLNKLTSNIFNKYIDNYIALELKCLKERSSANLQRYYESKNHQKKQIQSGGFQDLRRDIQAVIGTRANINIAQIENYGGETFLSEELAITILQDTKQAFQRCQLLSKPEDKASNASQILDRLLNSLLIEHVDYALELGLQAIPVVEGSKNPPTLYFFTVVHQSNNITHLLEKQITDLAVPLIINTPKYSDCMQKKKFILEDIERKVNTGLDRTLNAVGSWVKVYLQSEQKKTDFKPETDDFDTVASPACKAVSQYISNVIKEIKDNLDGNNVTAILQELGIRLHRVIYDHLLQFQFNTAGAMVAICDLNEYRSCTKHLGPLVAELFETLHALCNLLLVKPENLQQVCSEDSLVNLDRSVLHNFIQLRSDFKTQKQNFLKV
ncbi:exocyst complex component 5 [Tribolium castaneum]|uniref:Exocyst complex component 5 n=1 Tax=Tribolium castaneum TaxID=7070 RepID=D6WU95_TRICA|nr:PREDICTED: exocyst complex component 5 [Tribolium castaneum]EFA06250.1 Exocyst complex component 5-like Protein [Tribolium castaneum]|eukprot:XP_008195534.1 PREDICTED: exocyst complex component 5 [Tribolium castaneum]